MNEFRLAEREALDQQQRTWEKEGYRVLREPTRKDLPSFLGNFVPDALLVGEDENVVIEVIHKGNEQSNRKVREIEKLLEGKPEWRLEVLYVGTPRSALTLSDSHTINEHTRSVASVLSVDPKAALLLLWGIIEACARRLDPDNTTRPQSPGRVVELLAGAGHISLDDARILRNSLQKRNRVIHGVLDTPVSYDEVKESLSVTKSLVSKVEEDAERERR